MAGYVLYGVEASYYAAKIRAALTYKRIPFEEQQASRRIYADEIVPRVGWPVLPVLVTPDDETVQDTSDMCDLIEARHAEQPVEVLDHHRTIESQLGADRGEILGACHAVALRPEQHHLRHVTREDAHQ